MIMDGQSKTRNTDYSFQLESKQETHKASLILEQSS